MNVEISSDNELTKPLFVLSHKLSKNTIVRVTCKSITGVMIIKKYLQQQMGEKNIANYYIRKNCISTVKKCILTSRPGLGKPVTPDIFSFLEIKNRTKLNVLKDVSFHKNYY